jgi:hypothetical protein
MQNNTYNGWTNYETWRVNLEIFDGLSPRDIAGDGYDTPSELAPTLQAYAEDLIFIDCNEGLARNYAVAFMSEVNWNEVAEHLIENYIESENARITL